MENLHENNGDALHHVVADDLRIAATCVLKRWDSPLWRQEVGTAELMNRLRAALANQPAPTAAPEQVAAETMLRDMLAIQEACNLHTDEYAPGSVIEYIKDLENDSQPSEAAPLAWMLDFGDGERVVTANPNEMQAWVTQHDNPYTPIPLYRQPAQAAQHEAGAPAEEVLEAMKAILFSGRLVDTFMIRDLYHAALTASPVVRAQSEESAGLAAMIHYPACWDTAAYPTIQDAMREVAAYACTECAQQAHAGADEVPAPAHVEQDDLYDKAVMIVRAHGRASISLVQRHLRIGYNRAARLFDAMEAGGVVSGMGENGGRVVLAVPVDAAIRAAQEGEK